MSILTPYQKQFLTEPLALWMGSADIKNIPDTVRCLGVIVEDGNTLTCFIAELFSEQFISNISQNKQISLAVSHPYTFSGFQYKGEVTAINSCSPAEVEFQKKYMDVFSDDMAAFGLEKQKVYDMYFNQPSLAITMRVHKIFDQTPKENTGGETQL